MCRCSQNRQNDRHIGQAVARSVTAGPDRRHRSSARGARGNRSRGSTRGHHQVKRSRGRRSRPTRTNPPNQAKKLEGPARPRGGPKAHTGFEPLRPYSIGTGPGRRKPTEPGWILGFWHLTNATRYVTFRRSRRRNPAGWVNLGLIGRPSRPPSTGAAGGLDVAPAVRA